MNKSSENIEICEQTISDGANTKIHSLSAIHHIYQESIYNEVKDSSSDGISKMAKEKSN
jgi:hypothetical protein